MIWLTWESLVFCLLCVKCYSICVTLPRVHFLFLPCRVSMVGRGNIRQRSPSLQPTNRPTDLPTSPHVSEEYKRLPTPCACTFNLKWTITRLNKCSRDRPNHSHLVCGVQSANQAYVLWMVSLGVLRHMLLSSECADYGFFCFVSSMLAMASSTLILGSMLIMASSIPLLPNLWRTCSAMLWYEVANDIAVLSNATQWPCCCFVVPMHI